MQANAALPTCENEIKDVNTFLSLQGTARINDVDDLAKTLRSLTQTGRLPPATSPVMKRNVRAGRVMKQKHFGVLNPPITNG
jgi:hypothetical protein